MSSQPSPSTTLTNNQSTQTSLKFPLFALTRVLGVKTSKEESRSNSLSAHNDSEGSGNVTTSPNGKKTLSPPSTVTSSSFSSMFSSSQVSSGPKFGRAFFASLSGLI